MARLINFFYRRKRFYFKVKNLLLYCFRFWLIGLLVGFVTISIWYSFLNDEFTSNLIKLDSSLISQYRYILVLWPNWPIQISVVFVTLALLFLINKGFQTFLRGSLMYIGFLSWLLLNKYNFFTDPRFWQRWDIIPNSSFVIIFYIAFWVIVTGIFLLVVNSVLNQVGISIKPPIASFIKNLNDSITVNKEKLNLPKILKNPKKWWYDTIGENSILPHPSDEPLNDMSEIESIKKIVKNPDLFAAFLKVLERLKYLILKGSNKNSICLDGPWGSGKTSLVNVIHNDILKLADAKIIWIDFDPWNFSNSTELVKDFFETLNKELVDRYKIDLQPDLGLYIDLVTPLIESTGFFGNLRSLLLKIPFFASENIVALKKSIAKQLRGIPDKIVIILDDLDRLKFEEIETVLKLVRQLSDLPNILFILPFDYDRVSNLIAKEKGEGYRDFLGKIINDTIKLEAYSFAELEGMFINSVKYNPSDEEVVTLKDTFYVYVKEKNRSRFENVRRRESTTVSSDLTLNPAFAFANELFRILYPSAHLKNHYGVLESPVKNLLNFYLGDSTTTGDSLESEIFEKFSLIRKMELVNKFNGFKLQIDGDINSLGGANLEEIASLNKIWDDFIKSLSEGKEHKTIESNLNSIISFQITSTTPQARIYTLPNIKTALDQIGLDLAKYKTEFDDNSDYHTKIKNWLVQSITPRQIKDLARNESVNIGSVLGSKSDMIQIALDVAKMQY